MIQQEMLEYQKIDRELARIEKELRENENYVKFKQYKNMRQACEENIIRAESKAGDLKSQLTSLRESVLKVTAQIEEYCHAMDEAQDLDELNYLNKKLNEQLDVLASIEKDVKRVQREGEEAVKSLEEINSKLPQIMSLCVKFNNEFTKVKEEQRPRVAALKQKQTALKQTIEPSVFEIYKKVSEGQISPVFVELRDGTRCGGCQMEMPKAIVDAQFATQDYMRCEHCGRIIYKKA